MVKTFPRTCDGDQIIVAFQYKEERQAFLSAIKQMRDFLESNREEKELFGFVLRTTLETVVAEEHIDDLQRILGLQVLNINKRDFGKDEFVMIRN